MLKPYLVCVAINPDSPTNSQGSSFYSHLLRANGLDVNPILVKQSVFVIRRMSFLTKLVTPIQAVISVGVVMALSYRHIDEYNRHVQKYGPLGSMPRKRFAVEGPAPHRSEESPAQPEEGRLE